MFDGGDGDMEFTRDGGQRRQVHVDGDGGEDRQHPEQGDQLEAAAGSPERRRGTDMAGVMGRLRAAPFYMTVDGCAAPRAP